MTLIDCCLFAGEARMLELRMRALAQVVDHFAVVACFYTHQGEPADRVAITAAYDEAVAMVGPRSAMLHWSIPNLNVETHGRIYTRPADERGPAGSFWFQKIEKQHRDDCRDAAFAWSSDLTTTVAVSDVDEIPDPAVLADLAGGLIDHHRWVTCAMRFHSGAVNLLHPYQPWFGTTVSRLGECAPQEMRDARTTIGTTVELISVAEDAGVHLSWFGTDVERARKLATFSHAEHRGWDHVGGRQARTHVNGEELTLLSEAEVDGLWWPRPIVDGSFVIPKEWWA